MAESSGASSIDVFRGVCDRLIVLFVFPSVALCFPFLGDLEELEEEEWSWYDREDEGSEIGVSCVAMNVSRGVRGCRGSG